MDEKLKGLWSSNKILFFIALPMILLFMFRNLIFAILVGSARKTAEEAKKEDAKLQAESDQAKLEAAKAQAAADAAAKRIADRKEEDVDEDWHKKN